MTTKLKTNEAGLDPDISLRFAQWADLDAVTQMIYDVCEADGDITMAVTPEEMKHEWETPGFNVETDAIVAVTSDNRIVGYEEFYNLNEHAKLRTDGYVHPKFTGLGIGTTLMRAVEVRARKDIPLAAPDARVYIQSTLDSHDKEGRNIHESEGYSPVRFHWIMQIDLKTAPPVVPLPDGIELRPFIKGEHERAVWEADTEAFRDHWGNHEYTFDEWKTDSMGMSDIDPSLWMIAWDGDQIAGVSLNRYRMGIGWIRRLSVRWPWRKKGLGYSLLLRSFGEFYRRGTKTIGLGVDAQSPTGATRLYIKAGMHTSSELVTYEKELRPGKEISVQSLSE